MGRIWAIVAVMAVLVAVPAAAGEHKQVRGVVELFTSQGCNSCPPADKVLVDLVKEGDVVALGYHVDYWDYLGWKDTLGSAEFSQRQRDYAKTFGRGTVYTPQAVINGRTHMNGGSRRSIEQALAATGLKVEVSAEKTDNSLVIKAGDGGGNLGDAHLVLVYFDETKNVKIERGENRGRTITYANIVTGLQTAGMWHGDPVRYELPISEIKKRGSGGCAILLQVVGPGGQPGAILGATILNNG